MSDVSENESVIDSDAEKDVKGKEIVKINNVAGLNAKLKAIQLNLDWVEKLDITVNVEENEDSVDATDENEDSKAENDFKREMSFYNQALKSVSKAFKRLHKLGIPTRRPTDFFAEMAKSDQHMNKVREKLMRKQTAVEKRDQVRAIREQKKHGKKIQQQVLRERKAEKKKMLNALKKTKKGKMDANTLLNSGGLKDTPASFKKDAPAGFKKDAPARFKKDAPGGFNKGAPGGFNKGAPGGFNKGAPGGFNKGAPKSGGNNRGKKFRQIRDMKYGYGGKKKGSKWNTAESSASSEQKHSNGPMRNFSKDKKFGRNKPRPKSQRRRR